MITDEQKKMKGYECVDETFGIYGKDIKVGKGFITSYHTNIPISCNPPIEMNGIEYDPLPVIFQSSFKWTKGISDKKKEIEKNKCMKNIYDEIEKIMSAGKYHGHDVKFMLINNRKKER